MRPIVLMDCDGVVSDFLSPALAVASRITGKEWLAEHITQWDIFSIVGKEHEDVCFKEYKLEGFCRDIPPYPEALEWVPQIQKICHLCALTSPMNGPFWAAERTEWLERHLDIPQRNVMHVNSAWKKLVRGDLLIEDKPETVVDWLHHNPEGLAVLFKRPSNYEMSEGVVKELYHRLLGRWRYSDNWKEILEMINFIKERNNSTRAFNV